MPGADFTVSVTEFNSEETFELSAEWQWEEDDGTVTDFDWADYTFEYKLAPVSGCSSRFTLTDDDGITVDAGNNRITFTATMPEPGRYEHQLLATHTATGKVRAVFDGPVIIHEGL